MTKTVAEKNKWAKQVKQIFPEESKVKNKHFVLREGEIDIFYIEAIIDKMMFASSIVQPIQKIIQKQQDKPPKNSKKRDVFEVLKNEVLTIPTIDEIENFDDIKQKILSGNIVIVSGAKALSCPLFDAEKRSVVEPPTSKVVKGPREGFIEDVMTNLGLVRKRLKTENLKIIDLFVGKQTHTQISVCYIDKIAKPEVVEEVLSRIKSIDIDSIHDAYMIESFLEGNKLKFVRRVGNTEKPDVFCAKILEGRVGILVDGSPIALTVPFVLFEDLQSPGDYSSVPAMASFQRIMRACGLIFAILIPGIYVALQSYNYRILPINFLITLLSSIEGLSIPPLIEILFVLLIFEVVTEASLQMPNSLAMALSIIGALALGSTAVDAGIISPPSIVVVAISSVALYIIPDQISTTRLLRLLFSMIGGIIGLYGIVMSLIILTTYLTSIKSFGVPFLMPFAPGIEEDKKDGFVKSDVQKMTSRPKLLVGENKIRQRTKLKEQDLMLKNHKNSQKNGTKKEIKKENANDV